MALYIGTSTPAKIYVGTSQVQKAYLGADLIYQSLTLGWESAVSVSTVGDTIVSTTGTLVQALNLGDSASRTVNGVVFPNSSGYGGLGTPFVGTGVYADGVIGAAFESMMDCFCYNAANTSISLTGLTAGQTYLLQIFVSDDRAGPNTNVQTFTVAGYAATGVTNGASFSRICRFVASGTSETLSITAPGGLRFINGLQTRLL